MHNCPALLSFAPWIKHKHREKQADNTGKLTEEIPVVILGSWPARCRTHAYAHCKRRANASVGCRKRCPYCRALSSPGCRSLLLRSSNNWLLVCIIKQGMIDTERRRSFNWLLALSPNPLFLTRMQRSSKQYTVWYYRYYLIFVCIQTHTWAPLCMRSMFWEFPPICLLKECCGCCRGCVHPEPYPGPLHKQHLWRSQSTANVSLQRALPLTLLACGRDRSVVQNIFWALGLAFSCMCPGARSASFFCSKHGIPTMKHICKPCLFELGWTYSWLWDALPVRLLEIVTISGPLKEAWARVWFWRLFGPILTRVSVYACEDICSNVCSDHDFLHIHHHRGLTGL